MKPRHIALAFSIAVLAVQVQGEAAQARSDPDVQPKIRARLLQRYVAVRMQVSVGQLGKVIPTGIGQVGEWLRGHGAHPSGPPFVRYLVIDMPKLLDIEVGFPLAGPIKITAPLVSGAFPAGRYITYTYTGRPGGLVGANAAVLGWARRNSLTLDQKPAKHGVAWGARAECYMTNPSREPDPNKYKTRILFRLAK